MQRYGFGFNYQKTPFLGGFERDDIAQVCRIERTLVLVLIDWLLGGDLRAVEDGALALAVLNLVEYALQAFVLGSVRGR